jgi:vitamin B12 transporter
MHQTSLSLALGMAFVTFAHAETLPEFIGETIVVTATRTSQKLAAPLQHTSVITRSEIESSTAADLPTLLRQESGVEIAQTGGLGAQSAIRIRGSESDHVLVLIDGVRVNSVTTGATAIDQILLDEIERIEIVRGNVSSVYGSEAIGGVVQIFTRRGAGDMKVSGKVGAGVDHTRNLGLAIGGALGDTRMHFGAAHTQTDGFSSVRSEFIPTPFLFNPADIDDDAYRNTTLNFALSHQLAGGHEMGLSALQTRGNVQYDGTFQNHSDQTLTSLSAFSENRIMQNWQSRVQVSQGTDDLRSDLDGIATDRFKTRNRQLTWSNQVTTGAGSLTLGAEGLWQKLDSSQVYSEDARRVASVFGGYSQALGAHELQLNLRHDDYSDFGGATTGLVGYGYRLTPQWRLSASYSTAFKAPTFNELYTAAFAPFFVGNPNLDPERARSAELGLTYSGVLGLARATLFETRTRDLIVTVTDPVTFNSTLTNLDEARNRGLELSWGGQLAGLDGRAALTLQNPEDVQTGEALLRRATRFGSVALGQTHGAFDWRAEVLASGPHPDVHVTEFTRTMVPGYAVLNLNLGWKPARDWKLGGKLVNLLDKDYALVHGYNTQGRGAFIELAYAPE